MSKELVEALAKYKDRHNISWNELAERIGTTRLNLYRWRQARNIKGMGETVVRDFLSREKHSGRF
jgi:hypothetical protein